jgi:hydrogenase maturation protease
MGLNASNRFVVTEMKDSLAPTGNVSTVARETRLNGCDVEHCFASVLSPLLKGNWAVIGLGNPDRADDRAGLLVASLLKARLPERVFLETETPVESIFDLLPTDCDTILFVDAADFHGRSGEIRFFNSDSIDQFQPAVSTHRVPIGFWFRYASSQGLLPFLIGIQPTDLTWMGHMSEGVKSASEILSRLISETL